MNATDYTELLARLYEEAAYYLSDESIFVSPSKDLVANNYLQAAAAIRELLAQLTRHDATIDADVRENASLQAQLAQLGGEIGMLRIDVANERMARENADGIAQALERRAKAAEARLAVVKQETLNHAIHTVRVVLADADDGLGYDTLMQLLEDRIDALANQTAAAQETGKEPGSATGDMPAPAASEITEAMHKAAWDTYLRIDKRYVPWRDTFATIYLAMKAAQVTVSAPAPAAEKELRPTRRTGLERRRSKIGIETFEGEYRILPDWLHDALTHWFSDTRQHIPGAAQIRGNESGMPNSAVFPEPAPAAVQDEIARRRAQ